MRRAAKRGFDVGATLTALLVLSPLMAVVAVVIRMVDGPPVLFVQERPGRKGRPFRLYKFRTMAVEAHSTAPSRPDTDRLTPLGRRLRAMSIDELPTLVNVLRGDMSLVGPRPLLMSYLELYTAEQARRHDVRPGITGLAQVSGRNATTWGDRLSLDVEYVDNWSLWLDARILLRTFIVVLRRQGISHPGHATMPEFGGAEGQNS